jgi:hypothetical protein
MNFSNNFAYQHGTISSFVFTKYKQIFTRNQFVDEEMKGDEESSNLEIKNNSTINNCNFILIKI